MPGSTTDAGTENGGVLTLAAVPIGRPDDASARLVAELAGASLIAAEDTRLAQRLLKHHGITARLIALHEHNERTAAQKLIGLLAGENSLRAQLYIQAELAVTATGIPK